MVSGAVAHVRTSLFPEDAGATVTGGPVTVQLPDFGGTVDVALLGSSDLQTWSAATPGEHVVTNRKFFRVKAVERFVLVPAGSFDMGDNFEEGDPYERPVHSVYISPFYLQRTEVTKAQWDDVAGWASANGYDITPADGSAKGPDHPVQDLTWHDCVKYCNALSEREELIPVYMESDVVYRTGSDNPEVNDAANGYRLPTEAEWEKAARGGLNGKRFPWGDTISHSKANYYSSSSYAYDESPTRGYHPVWLPGGYPYTSPAGSFAPNGYGLYDMVGNVWEWCGDWFSYDYYGSSPGSDPTGPSFGSARVIRGGDFGSNPSHSTVYHRISSNPGSSNSNRGFRPARDAS